MIGVFDYDVQKYQIAAAGEKRSIIVRHPSGIEETFKTRTEFFGRAPKYTGGWLAEYNKDKSEPLLPCEFTIEDVQTPEPVEFVLSSVKHQINNIKEKLRLRSYYGYLGKGDSWRVEASTLLKYKGQRAAMIKPIHLGAVEEYLLKHHSAQFVEYLEADDQCVMDCYRNKNKILIGQDKDYLGVNDINLYNHVKDIRYPAERGLGNLQMEVKVGKNNVKSIAVRGQGRSFFYFQVLSGDDTDCYKANCKSDIDWGDVSAYNALKDCKTDKECWQTLVNCYKMLYPEKKVVKGWRGDDIEIDWLYVLQENVTLAHMLRWEGDNLVVEDILKRMEVDYG